MIKKNKYFVAAIGALAVAAPVIAAQDVPAPDLQNEAAILKWARDSKLTDDTANPPASWNLVGALDDGLLFASVQAPTAANGVAKVGIRLERYKPAGMVRSEANMFDLDCGKQQIKATYDSTFAEHNFGGAKQDRPLNANWTPVAGNEIVSAIKDDACKPAAPAATVAAVNFNDRASVDRWVTTNGIRDTNVGNVPHWSAINASNRGVYYSVVVSAEDSTRTLNLKVRLERFAPAPHEKLQGVLSETEDYEINCQNNRLRKTGTTWHSEHNLLGRNDGQRKIEPWSPAANHPLLAKPAENLCRDYQPSRKFETGR